MEKLYKLRLLLFLFKNKQFFHLHNTELITRTGKTTRATILDWKKVHSRMQARYQACLFFNKLPMAVREERKLSKYKREIQGRERSWK